MATPISLPWSCTSRWFRSIWARLTTRLTQTITATAARPISVSSGEKSSMTAA